VDRIAKYSISNIVAFNEDFLKSNPGNKKFRRVRMILADPSCSGSGMLVNFSNNT
jgi:16S rRNA C967 or C1407 C5-methylase (RsmB/RsmF family)